MRLFSDYLGLFSSRRRQYLHGEDEAEQHEDDEAGHGCRHDDAQGSPAPGLHVVPGFADTEW